MATDLTDRTFCVTGANTGIGGATAVALAKRGGRVIVLGRTAERMQATLSDIEGTPGSATFVPVDLGNLDSVAEAGAAVLALDEPVHVLVNNAGIGGQRGKTDSGFELMFGVNHVGHFLLTELLRDHIAASAKDAGEKGRIVIVASDAHFQAIGINFNNVRRSTRSLTGMSEYAVSKLANIVHAKELATRVDPSLVSTYSLHPGVIASDIWRRLGPLSGLTRLFMKSVEEGALTSLHCATDPDAADVTGRYWSDEKQKRPSPAATADLATELWKHSEEWVADYLPST